MELDELLMFVERKRAGRRPIRVRVCSAAVCHSSGVGAVPDGLEAALARAGLGDRAEVCEVGCMRHFGDFPTLFLSLVGDDGTWEHYDGRIRVGDAEGRIMADDHGAQRDMDFTGEAIQHDL